MTATHRSAPIPAHAGIGLRSPHHDQVLAEKPDVAWFEVHSENFFGGGGHAQRVLLEIRADYPISLHGVGLSLGSAAGRHAPHLAELKQLIECVQPGMVSEHLSWGALCGRHLNDLLPLPYTEQALQLMVERVDAAQTFLGRQILIENISSYLTYAHSTIPEWEFIGALASRTGCGLLCDVNNIHVNAVNHGFDARDYLNGLPAALVQEIHLAGFTERQVAGSDGGDVTLLIDTHSRPVSEAVWQLYKEAVRVFGPTPTLIERDRDIPEFATLALEAQRAERTMHHVFERA